MLSLHPRLLRAGDRSSEGQFRHSRNDCLPVRRGRHRDSPLTSRSTRGDVRESGSVRFLSPKVSSTPSGWKEVACRHPTHGRRSLQVSGRTPPARGAADRSYPTRSFTRDFHPWPVSDTHLALNRGKSLTAKITQHHRWVLGSPRRPCFDLSIQEPEDPFLGPPEVSFFSPNLPFTLGVLGPLAVKYFGLGLVRHSIVQHPGGWRGLARTRNDRVQNVDGSLAAIPLESEPHTDSITSHRPCRCAEDRSWRPREHSRRIR